MSSNDVRKGMTNAQFNEKQSGILMTEIFIIAVFVVFILLLGGFLVGFF